MSTVNSSLKRHAKCLHGRKIIILDDIPELAELFRKALELSGLEVVMVAHTGEELLEKLSRIMIKIDFALMDYTIDGGHLNGLETAVLVHKKEPEIRIVMASANDSIEQESIACGFSFLKKPIGIGELLDALS